MQVIRLMPFRGGFINALAYHVLNRGVEKREIFVDVYDYKRFVEILGEFNSDKPTHFHVIRRERRYRNLPKSIKRDKGNELVDIICFCLMPNHFHLLLRQKVNNGIATFMMKVCTGYASYFNKRYGRSGTLFQGRYKALLVKDDVHFSHLTCYIHSNPLKILPGKKPASELLKRYRWSSYGDFIGEPKYEKLASPKNTLDYIGGIENYKKMIDEYGENKFCPDLISELILE